MNNELLNRIIELENRLDAIAPVPDKPYALPVGDNYVVLHRGGGAYDLIDKKANALLLRGVDFQQAVNHVQQAA